MDASQRIEELLGLLAHPPESANQNDLLNWRTEAGNLYINELLRRASGLNPQQWVNFRKGYEFPDEGFRLRLANGPLPPAAPEPSRVDALERTFNGMYGGAQARRDFWRGSGGSQG